MERPEVVDPLKEEEQQQEEITKGFEEVDKEKEDEK